MAKFRDLTGLKFGKLKVIRRLPNHIQPSGQGKLKWECVCDCGSINAVFGHKLQSGYTKSCGCLKSETATKHGLVKHPLYQIWLAMKQRCYNKNISNHSDYGGRGITVCDRWLDSFENFFEDMGERPSDEYSIDRIDNNQGYSPENCKWSTRSEQSINQRVKKNNKSGVRGVCWDKFRNKWSANLKFKSEKIYLGRFLEFEDAIKARKDAELKYFGKFV